MLSPGKINQFKLFKTLLLDIFIYKSLAILKNVIGSFSKEPQKDM